MHGTKGKITFANLVLFIIIIYGAFVAFKIIGSNLEKKSIKKEVYDYLGTVRGSAFNEEIGIAGIKDILKRHGLTFPEEPLVMIDRDKGKIAYYLKYDNSINLIFFKRQEIITLEDELDTYGGL